MRVMDVDNRKLASDVVAAAAAATIGLCDLIRKMGKAMDRTVN